MLSCVEHENSFISSGPVSLPKGLDHNYRNARIVPTYLIQGNAMILQRNFPIEMFPPFSHE